MLQCFLPTLYKVLRDFNSFYTYKLTVYLLTVINSLTLTVINSLPIIKWASQAEFFVGSTVDYHWL